MHEPHHYASPDHAAFSNPSRFLSNSSFYSHVLPSLKTYIAGHSMSDKSSSCGPPRIHYAAFGIVLRPLSLVVSDQRLGASDSQDLGHRRHGSSGK